MLLTREEVLKGMPAETTDPEALHVQGAVRSMVYGSTTKLADVVKSLVPNEHVHMACFSRWGMTQLLELLLEKTGPADVWLTSWTITEEPMRRIVRLQRAGHIRSLAALFDDRAPKNNAEGAQLAKSNIPRLRFLPIHAKCMVLLNEQWGISVASSANLTRNKRIERYVISTHRTVAEADRTWIDEQL